ncbi:MAG TPA: hypothetical protein PKC59_11710 [Burkholderiaceae bacterium]|nr:hypothetical protein [Burkholderiaceae bacterium]HMZ01356.1 hypothetical protein [Burkholderiaceae bacterium]HNG80229.1 hypothetical protein [Burkholderiaceae bacterium]
MEIDYSQGRYNVFDANDKQIGRIDEDEFIRRGSQILYRIDGSEVYAVNGNLLAFIDGGIARRPDGEKLFSIKLE